MKELSRRGITLPALRFEAFMEIGAPQYQLVCVELKAAFLKSAHLHPEGYI
jgi:hypothetical protein